ncbi:S-adenosyl-L-methionine-dependent methyltransferase [Lipomyces kononenkoae]|uniref:S-adenosyl-L-methionine-dependent methyltransferase n=1 Tax=Lipomyces kononenkoae TaxID=34357 RepID=A0ACC3SYT6_LIPKO
MSRPEISAPPEVFYSDIESKKYTSSSRIQHIQASMTLRALDVLALPPHQHILDIGCGSGLSGEILSQEGGHVWVGMDISPSMLAVALDRDVEGDLFLADMGNGVPFRAGTFDAVISISAIQWLCNADSSNADPRKRLARFFDSLYAALKRGGKVACQFYPRDESQTESILNAAKSAGFSGGLVIDDEESKKNKKYYLILTAGNVNSNDINLGGVKIDKSAVMRPKRAKKEESRKEYILRKKDLMRKRGKLVALDSQFTGRKRKPRF